MFPETNHTDPRTDVDTVTMTLHFGIVPITIDKHEYDDLGTGAMLDVNAAHADGFTQDGSFDEWGEFLPFGEGGVLAVIIDVRDDVDHDAIDFLRAALARHVRPGHRLADYVLISNADDHSQQPRIAALWGLNKRVWHLTLSVPTHHRPENGR